LDKGDISKTAVREKWKDPGQVRAQYQRRSRLVAQKQLFNSQSDGRSLCERRILAATLS
jgi:hypothetical protein